jgi:hypothetical protein
VSGGAAGRVVVLALLLPACLCPTPVECWDTPQATLELWQARLCHDDVEGEYACFARSAQRAMGGFENYYTERARVLEERPAAAWLFRHADLADHIASASFDPDGRHAALVLQSGDEPILVSFEREAWITARWDDGRVETARHPAPPGTLVVHDAGRQWLLLERPELLDAPGLREVCVSARWLISDLAGMAAPRRAAEPAP